MRRTLFATTALGFALLGPAGVADATAEGLVRDLIANPQVCGQAGSAETTAPVADMVMVDGFGTGGFKVDTDNPQAQAWFDHGVRLRWAFEHSESVRAFRKARALDPQCGMCAWGEAWAIGPNLNGGGGDAASIETGLTVAREARRLARGASPMQRQMIDALIQRYSGQAETRSNRYAKAMDRIARRNTADVSVSALAADAWMLDSRGWWRADGQPVAPSVTRAVELLEGALARAPNDPGNIHLYIHLTEWSPDPQRAIPYADRLESLTPGASHLVHMPSHSYYRIGRYKDAMTANVKAVALDKRYDQLAAPPGGVPGMPLHAHNIHFGMGGALMAGGAEDGLALADWFMATYSQSPARNVFRQIMALNAYALYGRFANAGRIAALTEPPETHAQSRLGWRYARGEAAARRGDVEAVRSEIAAMIPIREAMSAEGPPQFKVLAELPLRVLEGRAAMLAGDHAGAITAFSRAHEIQNSVSLGGDPPNWWYPTARSLAAAQLASGDAAAAKATILAMAEDWPNDPYSYFVLSQAERALGDNAAAEEALRRSRIEWIGGDMTLAMA
jgi:tetratricopeptide (TPR) repeat protein